MKNKINWSKYLLEFISVFVAVFFAFALNNWNENRRDNHAELKNLKEISNGLLKDLVDINHNVNGHKTGIEACGYWRQVVNNKEFSQELASNYYLALTRDFVSLQNKAGYESLKSKGLELIKNDSLRLEIISLYEYDFKTLQKLEETYFEMQFQRNYYKELNSIILPYFKFNNLGKIEEITTPININELDRKRFMTYLWKIEENRNFILKYYSSIIVKTNKLINKIDKELN